VITRTRILALILVLCCASYLYAGPMEDARRMQQVHDRLLTIGVARRPRSGCSCATARR